MGANDGGVESRILIVAVGGERGEHRLLRAGMAPAIARVINHECRSGTGALDGLVNRGLRRRFVAVKGSP
jgi:hypothetical protein